MTYPAHVIMRFRLERAMVAGNLAVADLPGAWNGAIKDLMGITPPNDAVGCLQDIHWYDGAFGYFPCYTLGAMAAAQLMAVALRQTQGLKTAMGLGDLSPLMNWLHANVHAHGSVMGFNELLTAATGKTAGSDRFHRASAGAVSVVAGPFPASGTATRCLRQRRSDREPSLAPDGSSPEPNVPAMLPSRAISTLLKFQFGSHDRPSAAPRHRTARRMGP